MARFVWVCVDFTRKCRKKLDFLEKVDAQNLQNFRHAPIDLVFLFHDGHEHVNADRYPHLRLDGVLRRAEKRFDSQVLFDPFEE